MRDATIYFSDGGVVETNINGTDESIKDYYFTNIFTFGCDEYNEHKEQAVKVVIDGVDYYR